MSTATVSTAAQNMSRKAVDDAHLSRARAPRHAQPQNDHGGNEGHDVRGTPSSRLVAIRGEEHPLEGRECVP
jgi:hypothetical protein